MSIKPSQNDNKTQNVEKSRQEIESELQTLISDVLQQAKQMGATDAEAGVSRESGLSVNVRLGAVDTIEFHKDKSLSITIYKGKRKGSVSSTDLSKSAIKSSLEAALRIADYTEEDPCMGLADPENLAREIPDCDLYHPWKVTPEQAIAWAKECEDTARSFDPKIVNSEGAGFSTHSRIRVYGNTNGFLGTIPSSRHSMSCAVIGELKGSLQRDYDFTVARDGHDLESRTMVGKRAALRTVRRLGGQKMKTCVVPVIFSAEIAHGLLAHFISAISGGNLYRRSSFLLDMIGKPIFPKFVHIEENPHLPKGLGSAPFDQEGVATKRHDLIREGILQSYVLGSYSSRKLGLKTTGNAGGVHNVIISTGTLDQPGLLKKMQKGLLVTELMGQGINIVTGDYSRGASGFWVENGEIQYPVEEITIAGNLKDMFLGIVDVGTDVDKRSGMLSGSILIDKMTVAGN